MISKTMHLTSKMLGILSRFSSFKRQFKLHSIGSVINTMYLSSSAGYSIQFNIDGCLNLIKFMGSFFIKLIASSFIFGEEFGLSNSDFFLSQRRLSSMKIDTSWFSRPFLLAAKTDQSECRPACMYGSLSTS